MPILRVRDVNGNWVDIPAIVGPVGPKGADGTMTFEDLTPEQRESLRGPEGPKGADGCTPARGEDYWTDADIEEIKSYVDNAILGGEW